MMATLTVDKGYVFAEITHPIALFGISCLTVVGLILLSLLLAILYQVFADSFTSSNFNDDDQEQLSSYSTESLTRRSNFEISV
ncbi:hypothetical protein Ciccas_004199 [Cichlidogyrus casuarinus]|uniref:Uncharacterized protein n=1 Tax=Cichlidogyrus casuarinus TaxID=1844966 RepID=A0ABD2QC63_9PLAT